MAKQEVTIKTATSSNPREYKGNMMAEQQAALDVGKDYPLVFRVNVKQGSELKPGIYGINVDSYVTDQFGNLGIKRLKLDWLRALDAAPAK